MVDRSLSAHRALASASRMALLHHLQQSDRALRVDELAEAVGLHVNTTREHLDRLVTARFVARESEVRATRGRPRMLYRAAERDAAATVDPRLRDQLARLLIEGYGQAMDSPAEQAEAAGQEWVRAQPSVPATVPATVPDAHGQVAALESHFEDLGFAPEADMAGRAIHLHRCPVAELARERTEVVCSVHLGIARGVLSRNPGPVTAERLEPFVGPQHCVLHLGGV